MIIIVNFVILSMIANLSIWYFIYEMKTNDEFYKEFYYLLFDIDAQYSTGNIYMDGLFNGLLIAAMIALLSLILLFCLLNNLDKLVAFYIRTSFLLMVLFMPIYVINDFFTKYIAMENPYYIAIAVFITIALYWMAILMAYFTNHSMAPALRQVLNVLNCSFVSVYYLRMFPRQTIWFLLMVTILWDLFAVDSSFGPLKLALQNAKQYNEQLLRFIVLIDEEDNNSSNDSTIELDSIDEIAPIEIEGEVHHYTDENGGSSDNETEEDGNSTEESSSSLGTAVSGSRKTYTSVRKRTAHDALTGSGMTLLGLGDMIIYNVLVGKVATFGCPLATIATIVGVVVGLYIVLSLSKQQEDDQNLESNYKPAVPLPIVFGMVGCGVGLLTAKTFPILVPSTQM